MLRMYEFLMDLAAEIWTRDEALIGSERNTVTKLNEAWAKHMAEGSCNKDGIRVPDDWKKNWSHALSTKSQVYIIGAFPS